MVVHDFTYVANRLKAKDWTKAVVMDGFITDDNPKGIMVFQFLNNDDLHNQLNLFEQYHQGEFTMRLNQSGIIIYFQNGMDNNNLNGVRVPTGRDMEKVMQLTLENKQLKEKIAELEEELKQFETSGQKFSYAMEHLLERVAVRFNLIPGEAPMQGTQRANPKPTYMAENLEPLEQAFVTLVENFGEDWLIRFAQKINDQPQLVNQIKSYFS